MALKTEKQMIRELHHSFFGIEGTEDKGAIKDIKDMSKQLRILNGAVRTNTAWRKAIVWVIGIMILAIIALYTVPL